MQRFSNKPRRPKAKAVENRPAARPPAARSGGGAWHDIVTSGLFTSLGIFIALQLMLAIPGKPPAVAAVGDHIVVSAASISGGGAPVITGREGTGQAARTCRLNLAIMKHPGGVLTVLQAAQSGVLLSWAGGATAPGAANCRGREIMVSADDYATLLSRGPRNINAR